MTISKTTAAGIVTIVGAAVTVALQLATKQPINIPTTVTAVTAGTGLILAQDQQK